MGRSFSFARRGTTPSAQVADRRHGGSGRHRWRRCRGGSRRWSGSGPYLTPLPIPGHPGLFRRPRPEETSPPCCCGCLTDGAMTSLTQNHSICPRSPSPPLVRSTGRGARVSSVVAARPGPTVWFAVLAVSRKATGHLSRCRRNSSLLFRVLERYPLFTSNTDYLVFSFGPWVVPVADPAQSSYFTARMTNAQRVTWARSFDAHVTRDGYLVFSPKPPLQVLRGSIDVLLQDTEGVIEIAGPQTCPATQLAPQIIPGGRAWCDSSVDVRVSVTGQSGLVDSLWSGLVIRPLRPIT